MRKFVPGQQAIRTQAAIDIDAPPDCVAAMYRDVDRWGETFSATIERAQITKTGDNWKEIQVTHRQEGQVPNTLIEVSKNEIGLEESKKGFNASFLNRFEPMGNGGTHYVIDAYINLNGVYRLVQPFLKGYVRRQTLKQIRNYVLVPLKIAAERHSAGQTKVRR